METEIVTLNDGLEYVIVDEISSNGNVYVYLSNVDNPDKFCIRKKIYNNELHLLNLPYWTNLGNKWPWTMQVLTLQPT